MNGKTWGRILAVLALVLTSGCSIPLNPPITPTLPTFPPSSTSARAVPPPTTAPPAALRVFAYASPPAVTGLWAGPCVARDGGLPDPRCTPGSVGPLGPAQVCAVGFEKTERPSGTETAKVLGLLAYSIPVGERGTVELDHLVPLSLGGSNDVTNLWPERSDIPNAGFRNRKDAVELKVLAAACPKRGKARITLAAAQWALARDWTTATKVLGL